MLRPTDPQRNLRALEIVIATGKPLASFQRDRHGALLEADSCLALFLSPDRDVIDREIEERAKKRSPLEELGDDRERRVESMLDPERTHAGCPFLSRT